MYIHLLIFLVLLTHNAYNIQSFLATPGFWSQWIIWKFQLLFKTQASKTPVKYELFS